MSYKLSDKNDMLNLGGRIYDCVAGSLKSKGGALEIAAEIMRELVTLATLMSRHLELINLNPLKCQGPEVRILVALSSLRGVLHDMKILSLTKLQLSCLDDRMSRSLLTELWIIRALVIEAVETIKEFLH